MSSFALICWSSALIAIAIWLKYPAFRRQMVVAGLLALPVLAIQPLISRGFWTLLSSQELAKLLLTRGILIFSLSAFLASIYEMYWRHYFTPEAHPSRRHLLWLMAGPVIFAFSLVLGQSFVSSLVISLFLDAVIVLIVRRDLVWDALFSSFLMGLLYGLVFWLTLAAVPGDLANFGWFSLPSGLNFFGLPIEELLIVILFGALWGPIYVAIKDLQSN